MNYWLDLFTGNTWEEFQQGGATVTGFREHNKKRASKIQNGDIFLCYLTGVKRWVGILQATGTMFEDESTIWSEETFPVRFPIQPQVLLKPEHGVPMEDLRGKLSFFPSDALPGSWSGMVRGSPTKYPKADGEIIAEAIRNAAQNPVSRPVDPKKLKRSCNIYKLHKQVGDEEVETVVTIPTEEEENEEQIVPVESDAPTHTEIQYRLLDVGSKMGLNIWAPKPDRNKNWNGNTISGLPRLLQTLPTQFDDVTTGTIENIDVLWLSGNAIVAAFEVEHTTSIYSGLLRMSDLLTMQPNIDIKLYLVAPDERFGKFKREVPRPTFASRKKPLHTVCSFLPYSELCQQLEKAKDLLCYLKPDFIDNIAELYDPAEEYDA